MVNLIFHPSDSSDPNELLAELNTRLVEDMYAASVNVTMLRADYERLGDETFKFHIENNLFAAAKHPITWEIQ